MREETRRFAIFQLRRSQLRPWVFAFLLVQLAIVSTLSGCGSGNFDPKTHLGKQAILDAVAIQLSTQNCSGAIAQIQPVYNSVDTDNEIRMMMASAYGCAAHINLFQVLGDIGTNSAYIVAGGLWSFLFKEYPSTAGDSVAEGAQAAQDALLSVLDPGAVILANNEFNVKGFNPGSYQVQDRLANANAYLFFAEMAGIGSLESRYKRPLPWTAANTVTADGCAYASAVVNFADSLNGLAAQATGNFQTSVKAMQSTFQTLIYGACNTGCVACGIGGGCPNCPLALRDRTSCTAGATDPPSCAAAQIATMVNTQWALFP